jgi:glyoxylase-like metal-dependent hydrolase (beta-lactamase superfamily II)
MDGYWQKDSLLGESYDVFGDGSLKIFDTAGHAEGHISALIRTKESFTLLTFDVAHLKANFDLGIPSGAVVSREDALDSLSKLKQLSITIPALTVVFGHEPSQWICKTAMEQLDVLGGKCVPPPVIQPVIQQ